MPLISKRDKAVVKKGTPQYFDENGLENEGLKGG
jgi:hypothetical protein